MKCHKLLGCKKTQPNLPLRIFEGEKLVTITLTNRNLHSQDRQVAINIITGTCSFADNREISIEQLIANSDFTHPLITEPFIQTPDYVFHYEYDTIDAMLYSGIYVYSRLIQTDNPLACSFKINPSPLFKFSKCADSLYFSINGRKAANELLSIRQFEAITSHVQGLKFVFSENVIIDDQFTTENLPSSVNGDSLYKVDEQLITLLKNPKDFSCYEVRYISPEVGFGVFTKKNIEKGETISFYAGKKNDSKVTHLDFAFKPDTDCLAMHLDAIQFGNITRYINHAPAETAVENNYFNSSPEKSLLTSNLKAYFEYTNGIEFLVYKAYKNILKGEQLLVNYGDDYFENFPLIRFKSNGRLIKTKKKYTWNNSMKKIKDIRIMADYGVKKAQIYLIVRLVIITSVFVVAFRGLLALFRA